VILEYATFLRHQGSDSNEITIFRIVEIGCNGAWECEIFLIRKFSIFGTPFNFALNDRLYNTLLHPNTLYSTPPHSKTPHYTPTQRTKYNHLPDQANIHRH
jgi:hypothetical protein